MRVPLKIGLVLLLVAVSASSSWALIETYLPGGAQVEMKFTNYDAGTRYFNLPIGETDPDTLPTLAAEDATVLTPYKVVGPYGDDGWGVFFLSTIQDLNVSTIEYYNRGLAPFEITGIFWGLDDELITYNGTDQFIQSNDLQFAMFEGTPKNFAQGNPLLRGAGETFPTVTDGSLIWTGNSVLGDALADPYEFRTTFTPTTNIVGGGGFYAATGAVDSWGEGPLNWMFAELLDGVNFKFQFTADGSGAGLWPLKSQDPIEAEITPELSSGGLMLLGMLPIGVAWFRRRKA
jgi:hypothetical protein